MKIQSNIARQAACALLLSTAALASCSVIDDDLSDCGSEAQLTYELRLVTNMTTELQTQLTTQTDLQLAAALRAHLSNIFTDYAHDVDLSFYGTHDDSLRLYHDQHLMNANQASYTFYLPMRQYMHLAVANIQGNAQATLANSNYCHTASVVSSSTADTVPSHNTGIFTARLPMDVLGDRDQTFNVHLYMANCASSLVVDTVGSGIRAIQAYSTGFATAFSMADSTYTFTDRPPIVRTEHISDDSFAGAIAFCSVSFPSPEERSTRTIIETTEPFISTNQQNSLWEFHVYATTASGTTTRSVLYVNTPLRAGQLKIIKAKVSPDGTLDTDNATGVGVSVTLDWKPGGTYTPEL